MLDARLEKWTQIQCDQHRAAVRTELTRRFEEQLALQQQQQQEQLMDSEVSVKHVTEATDLVVLGKVHGIHGLQW